jgi:hypothetical protein
MRGWLADKGTENQGLGVVWVEHIETGPVVVREELRGGFQRCLSAGFQGTRLFRPDGEIDQAMHVFLLLAAGRAYFYLLPFV